MMGMMLEQTERRGESESESEIDSKCDRAVKERDCQIRADQMESGRERIRQLQYEAGLSLGTFADLADRLQRPCCINPFLPVIQIVLLELVDILRKCTEAYCCLKPQVPAVVPNAHIIFDKLCCRKYKMLVAVSSSLRCSCTSFSSLARMDDKSRENQSTQTVPESVKRIYRHEDMQFAVDAEFKVGKSTAKDDLRQTVTR